ncbi:glycosyltransferase family 2 protein [Pigmentiphaga kullae]|uniref:Rhamnopyranosyl-N-acetylglucosaminyl-diphospho-decaprenol beta-1,3/1,4-galactofuranosyltransferase n=1 Tax=Pigmentiphaga kullae TaxID=151784 RepID=A0A4Q7N6R8_9BURK|nr:glycosyltransferase family 2 protein [Pigmentiphaga kullae]RZS77044.1 rhamnopyranosyl-N-acetylglucosaminyl-diphospho-decaprenol beta-1,3/1,4-galactofuranosyltransferase [Pigmentiphaga kullae]
MHVCAVVVTYNRKALLARCLKALLGQQRPPDRIIIIDNASTDGTPAALEQDGTLARPDVELVTLERNEGGAGGFHHGLERAMRSGAELAWLMDDDGHPAPDCLQRLLEARQGLDLWGPVVLDDKHPDQLCFPLRLPRSSRILRSRRAVEEACTEGLLPEVVMPFNGVLVTRELVAKIGLPRKEFFIWGDDIEYVWRAARAGAQIVTVCGASFYHPRQDDLGAPMFFGLMHFNNTGSLLKHYCLCRNNTANLLAYRGRVAALVFAAKTLWFYTFSRPSLARLRLSLRALAAGWRGDFSGHRRFIE